MGRITEELERLATQYDIDMADVVGRLRSKSWGDRAALLKLGEKLGSDEQEVRKIVNDIADNAGLSFKERQYLLGRVFNPPKFRKIDDD